MTSPARTVGASSGQRTPNRVSSGAAEGLSAAVQARSISPVTTAAVIAAHSSPLPSEPTQACTVTPATGVAAAGGRSSAKRVAQGVERLPDAEYPPGGGEIVVVLLVRGGSGRQQGRKQAQRVRSGQPVQGVHRDRRPRGADGDHGLDAPDARRGQLGGRPDRRLPGAAVRDDEQAAELGQRAAARRRAGRPGRARRPGRPLRHRWPGTRRGRRADPPQLPCGSAGRVSDASAGSPAAVRSTVWLAGLCGSTAASTATWTTVAGRAPTTPLRSSAASGAVWATSLNWCPVTPAGRDESVRPTRPSVPAQRYDQFLQAGDQVAPAGHQIGQHVVVRGAGDQPVDQRGAGQGRVAGLPPVQRRGLRVGARVRSVGAEPGEQGGDGVAERVQRAAEQRQAPRVPGVAATHPAGTASQQPGQEVEHAAQGRTSATRRRAPPAGRPRVRRPGP